MHAYGKPEIIDGNEKVFDLLDWQKSVILDLNYNPEVGVNYNTKYDWHTWYNDKNYKHSPKLRKQESKYLDKTIRSDGNLLSQEIVFHKFTDKQRDKMFVHQMVVGMYQRRNRLLLKDLD